LPTSLLNSGGSILRGALGLIVLLTMVVAFECIALLTSYRAALHSSLDIAVDVQRKIFTIEPEPPKGEPDSFDLYRRPSLAIFVDSSLGICSFYELPGGSPMAEVAVVCFSRLLLSIQ